ncbi:MAG: hypothetical protein ACYDCC_03665 [Actinomycetota bacterium]
MKKLAALFAMTSIVASFGASHATAALAYCSTPIALDRACYATFTLASPTSVQLSLTPQAGFTGFLTGSLQQDHDAPCAVKAFFIGGTPVPDAAMQAQGDPNWMWQNTCTLGAGDWKLNVTPGAVVSQYPIGVQNMDIAFGSTGGTVTLAPVATH